MGLSSETMRDGFYTDTIEHPNPGFVVMEIWKDIPGYEGRYCASNLGNVKSLDWFYYSKGAGKIPYKINHYGKLLKQSISPYGYYYVGLHINSKQYGNLIHRLIALAFIPNPKNKPQINHIDGNKANNHVNNLEWCTQSENMQHSYKIGLNRMDNDYNNNSKLNSFQVRVIRKAEGLKQYELAKIFNVTNSSISQIINNKIWTK